MNKFLRLSVLTLFVIGACSACSKDNDNESPTPEMKNWMKAGERQTEIKIGASNVRDLDKWVNFTFSGAGITYDRKADGTLWPESAKGVGDFVDIEIWGLDKITLGEYNITKDQPIGSAIGATVAYVQDLDAAATMESEDEEYIGAYIGDFTKGIVTIEKSGEGYLIKVDGECVNGEGVVKKVTLQYDDKLENVEFDD